MFPLESVPNVSEGRRAPVFDRLARALSGHRGARLLDASRDPDHNRAVFTLAGDAAGLSEALLELYRVALAEVDLRRHQGIHPRIGAVDVVPFVALGDTPARAAVAAAADLARRVAERFEIPVFLYEQSAAAPHRRRLADLRRGGPQGLAARMAASPEWRPDLGPPRLHPTAGATVIGARPFLVAANALLDTADPEVARAVARTVRESSGGLPGVRALGLLLPSRGLAQVSMNLVDLVRTLPAAAFEAVSAAAAQLGARVIERELIGLVPAAALGGEGEEAEALRRAWAGRTLEARLGKGGGG